MFKLNIKHNPISEGVQTQSFGRVFNWPNHLSNDLLPNTYMHFVVTVTTHYIISLDVFYTHDVNSSGQELNY